MTVFFPDVSHYQAGMSLRGATFVIAKATQGGSATDSAYAGFKAQAASLGIGFSAYHWVDTTNLATQAAHAHAVIGSVPTMWDAEASGATVSRLVELTSRYRALGGNPRAVYLPHWWWQQLGSPDLRPLTSAGLFLVSSDFPAGGYSPTGPGWTPYGGMSPAIWQYTDSQSFNGYVVDFNAFRGTINELLALWGLGGTQASGEESMMISVDATGQLYLCDGMRSRPITQSQVSDLAYLASQGLFSLAKGPGNNAEWTQGGLVRLGWTAANMGPITVPTTSTPGSGGTLAISLTGTATPTS